MPQEPSVKVVADRSADQAVVFIHGFSGKRAESWGNFPLLLAAQVTHWNVSTFGYRTTLWPNFIGVWSADPDLAMLARLLRAQLTASPHYRHRRLALVAHSMGGLVVQRALLDDTELAARTKLVVLFGTPSNGLKSATWFGFWKRQVANMAQDGDFIRTLRSDWINEFGQRKPFSFAAVAGDRDRFVPPESSLEPFPENERQVVPGDHFEIVKPSSEDSLSVQLVASFLLGRPSPRHGLTNELSLAAEVPTADSAVLVREFSDSGLDPAGIVNAALALERHGKREESIKLLNSYKDEHTDIKGTLAGRFKRLWFATGESENAERALELYTEALTSARLAMDQNQIYYLEINVAFLTLTHKNDLQAAQVFARKAREIATPPGRDLWRVATVAEANLYLGETETALAGYRELLTLENVEDWQLQSTFLQAGHIALTLNDEKLANDLQQIFTAFGEEAKAASAKA